MQRQPKKIKYMTYVKNEKIFSKKWFYDYSMITIGCFILSAAFVFFITPHKIVPGGVYGISIVIHYLTKGMPFYPDGFPVGLMGLILNVPLTIIGIKILGPRFGIKTVVGFILCWIFMDSITLFWNQHNGSPDMPLVNDVLLSCIFGGALIGFGLGLVFKSRATSGGSDIVAMIIAKYTRWPLGQLLIIVDSAIVLISLIAFDDWLIPLYSWVVIYITGKAIDMTIEGVNYDKSLFIVSDKYMEIKDKIINDLNRGGTMLHGEGLYKGSEKKVIFTNVNRREMIMLQGMIKEIDPKAFITVFEANEILGEGFRSLNEKITED